MWVYWYGDCATPEQLSAPGVPGQPPLSRPRAQNDSSPTVGGLAQQCQDMERGRHGGSGLVDANVTPTFAGKEDAPRPALPPGGPRCRTGRMLDDAHLRTLEERLRYLRELEERRGAILESIRAQGKLDDALAARIAEADSK